MFLPFQIARCINQRSASCLLLDYTSVKNIPILTSHPFERLDWKEQCFCFLSKILEMSTRCLCSDLRYPRSTNMTVLSLTANQARSLQSPLQRTSFEIDFDLLHVSALAPNQIKSTFMSAPFSENRTRSPQCRCSTIQCSCFVCPLKRLS